MPPSPPTAGAGDPADGLEIRLFGPMDVRTGSRPLPRLRSRKGLWLLALLVLRAERPVDRDWLAGTLWPEADLARGRRSLRQSLYDLRLALGPEAWRLPDEALRTVRLDLSGAVVDVLQFDAAVARGGPDSLETAVALYRGPLLEGCVEEWAHPERRQREEAYVAALQRLAAAATARQDRATAASYLKRAVGADPYREELQRALIEALAQDGNPAGAEAPAGPRPRSHLPRPLSPFVGRERELRAIGTCLANARLVTLTGSGGIGKTRLALRAAEEHEREHGEEAGFGDLAPLTDPELVPQAVVRALRVRETPGQPVTETLAEWLRDRPLLLVLDNCEHLIDACARLAEALLSACPYLRVLATSRQPLGLNGETVWPVPPLSLPPVAPTFQSAASPSGSSAVLQYEAVRLFVERAAAVESGFALDERSAEALVQICRRLDGIPLAIELAAARARVLSLQQIADRLDDRFQLLTGGSRTALPRQQTLCATFDWSWDLLSPAAQTLLRRLSVFAGGWTLEAADAVCGDFGFWISDFGSGPTKTGTLTRPDRPPLPAIQNPNAQRAPEIQNTEVLDQLSALVDRSLVLYRPATDPDPPSAGSEARYHLLETVRHYAAQQLEPSGEQERMQMRHRDYFLAWAEAVKPKLWGAEQGLWFARLEAEHDNLRAALEFCRARGEVEEELRLAVAVSRFWDTCGHVREGRARLDAALARVTPSLPHSLREAALEHAGWMAYMQNDQAAAQTYYEQALAISREHHDEWRIASLLNMLASLQMERYDLAGARALYEESLALSRKLGSPGHATLGNLGNVVLWQGDLEAARGYLEESAVLSAAKGDHQQHGLVLCNLSIVALRQGRHAEAREQCAAGLRLLHDCGAIVSLPMGLDQMAAVAQVHGEWERAARLLGAAAGLREAAGLELQAFPESAAPNAATLNALGEDAFAALFAEGRAMDPEAAVAHALG